MANTSLNHFIQLLEKEGELIRISEFVSPYLEISEISDRISKEYGPALLFENTGTEFPLLINALGSEKRICIALGVSSLDEIGGYLSNFLKTITTPKNSFFEKLKIIPALKELSSWMPKSISGKGACQEIVMSEPDINKLPVLTCWPFDGGPFVTLPVVHTQDPINKSRNVGMYRMQIFDKELTGMHWHLHKNSARHYYEYKKLGMPMPVSVTLGGDPVYTYVATAPLPDNFDEYILAGFLRRKKVRMVKCLTNELEVPEDVDFVIEGFVDPNEELILEGPFGDHTGFYSLADYYPKFHITCITHKRNAVYPATIVGIPPQEDAWIGKATERIFLEPIRLTMHPDIIDIHMPMEGVFHNLVIFKTHQGFAGQALKIINGLWGAGQMMFTKVILAVDSQYELSDYLSLAKHISENVNIEEDIIFSKGPSDVLDHSSARFAFGGKIGVDACTKPSIIRQQSTLNSQAILCKYPQVSCINDSLIELGVSLAVISIKKESAGQIKEMCNDLFSAGLISGVKFLVFVDSNVDCRELKDVAWLVLNNIDPQRDIYIANKTMIIDGSSKSKKTDQFDRLWPNVIVMNDETIEKVDSKWNKLGLGNFIPSPSLKYKKLVKGNGAVVE